MPDKKKFKFKVVDTFNGGDHYGEFATIEEARSELQNRREEFYSTPGLENSSFKLAIVPANAEWGFDHRNGRWEWS